MLELPSSRTILATARPSCYVYLYQCKKVGCHLATNNDDDGMMAKLSYFSHTVLVISGMVPLSVADGI